VKFKVADGTTACGTIDGGRGARCIARCQIDCGDASNRALGRAGEERVLAHERATLLVAGRTEPAERIRWVSHVNGDGAGYDPELRRRRPRSADQVKTIIGWERTPFHITRNELAVTEEQRSDWAWCGCGISNEGQRRSS